MNRSALFLSLGALLLVSACSRQEAANTTPSQDTLPPAEQTAPADSATPESTPPATDPSVTTPDSESATTPPGGLGYRGPGRPTATPVAARGSRASGPR